MAIVFAVSVVLFFLSGVVFFLVTISGHPTKATSGEATVGFSSFVIGAISGATALGILAYGVINKLLS
jgi:hypothetical protein